MIANVDRLVFPLGVGMHFLDVGSGSGSNATDLCSLGATVSAVEIDDDLVCRFPQRFPTSGVHMVQANAQSLPFRPDQFDGVLILEVLEHIERTGSILQEIHRVVKPGGRVCLAVPTEYSELLYWRLHPRYASNATHLKIFSKRGMVGEIESTGLKVLAVQTRNFRPAVSWFFHAVLRSESDHTGLILNHPFVDSWLDRIFRMWEGTPILNRILGFVSSRVGKSWYFYCEKEI